MKLIKTETVKCPECGKHIEGRVEELEGYPFYSYTAHCPCGYIITESEYEPVGTGDLA